jgi:hypothetical protein
VSIDVMGITLPSNVSADTDQVAARSAFRESRQPQIRCATPTEEARTGRRGQRPTSPTVDARNTVLRSR